MTDVSSRWYEVGERLEALGLKLKQHFQQTGREDETADTLQRLRSSVNEAFESAGNAVKDDAVKSDVRETGRLLLDALSASLAKASEKLKDDRVEDEKDDKAPPAGPKAVE